MSVIKSTAVVPTNLIVDVKISIDLIQNTDEIKNEEDNVSTYLIQNIDEIIIVDGNISTDLIKNTDGIKIGCSSVDISKIQPLDDDSVEVVECKTLTPIWQRNWIPKDIIILLDYYHGLPGNMNKGTAVRWAIDTFRPPKFDRQTLNTFLKNNHKSSCLQQMWEVTTVKGLSLMKS